MKHIMLTGAAYSNGGAYVDAGNVVAVGDAKHEITEERAADIVKCGRADEVDVPDADADDDDDGDAGESESESESGEGGGTPPAKGRRGRTRA